MYYHFDERLEQDEQKAAAQDEKVRRLLGKLPFLKKRNNTAEVIRTPRSAE